MLNKKQIIKSVKWPVIALIAYSHIPTVMAQVTPEAEDSSLCTVEPIVFNSSKLMPGNQIKVQANRAEIIENKVALFTGNVDIVSNAAYIHAAKAQINENGKQVIAEGNVSYQDAQLKVASDSASLDSDSQSFNMLNTKYQLTGFVGRGAADAINVSAEKGLSLQKVSFTTCPLDQEDWKIVASEISIERGSFLGESRHTRFYVGDVPVLYLPYFAFPISTVRQTGLLFPNISSSSSTGIDYEQPFYWNMAPNYDMTISPRIMTSRGVQLKTEFRYLTEAGSGQLNLEYMPSDSKLSDSSDRYFYRYIHKSELNPDWTLNANINGMSDDNYIVDLGSDFYSSSDTHLYRTLGVNYYSENLDFSVYLRDFEIIGDSSDTYRAMPEAKLNYEYDIAPLLKFNLDSELAYFDTATDSDPTAWRWHLAPTLSLPYQRHWGEVTAELSVLNTYYRQSNGEDIGLEDEVNRTLGQARLYSALYFEQQDSWFDDNSTVTFEPKMQYLFTSYEDQSTIGLYDSTALLTDFNGLFRGQEFTGLDRISDNNQITLGVTSRIIDSKNREQLVVSLGQIFYLEDSKLTSSTQTTDRSALAGELDWRLNKNLFVHSGVQITTDTDKVERSSLTFEYRKNADSLIQLTHRYVRNLSDETIQQVGISASWPIAKNWQWVGRTYRDLELDRSIENYFGIQYESCCWALQVVAQRQLTNRYSSGSQSTDDFDSSVALQFIFKGMSNKSSSKAMLEDGMFGYREPYVLN
jgi:LPS-assembly protein